MLVASEPNQVTGHPQLTRATLKALYDGTLFYKLERAVKAKKKAAAAKRAAAKASAKSSITERLGQAGR